MRRFVTVALIFLFTLPVQAAILDGETLNYQYHFNDLGDLYSSADNGDKVVGVGIEVANIVGGVGTMDIYDNGFYIDFVGASSFSSSGTYNGFVLTDINDTVGDFTAFDYVLNTNMVGLSLANLYITENELGLNFSGLSFNADTFVELNIRAVPLPAAAWLFGSSLLGLIGLTRRKKAMAA